MSNNIADVFEKYSGYQVDSRLIEPGNLFFALSGTKADGHSFLSEVARRGGKGAVVDQKYVGEDFGLRLFRVPCVLSALQLCAHAQWKRIQPYVIGVTGSVGKTTTKELIATVLEGERPLAKTPKSLNSQIGLPLSILSMTEPLWVLEMGMSQPGEITDLVRLAPPDLAVIGRIALAHAAFFPGGVEDIAAAKAEILSQSQTKIALIHAASSHFIPIAQAPVPQKITFCGGDYIMLQENRQYVIRERGVDSPSFTLTTSATHFGENALAAAAVARILGLSWEVICSRMPRLLPVSGRFETKLINHVTYIHDAYNASPVAVKAALENLPPGKRKIAVLGTMRELGSYTQESHLDVGKSALEHVDVLIGFGVECASMVDLFSKAGRPAMLFEEFSSLKLHLQSIVEPGDVVLVKGSNSLALWRIFD